MRVRSIFSSKIMRFSNAPNVAIYCAQSHLRVRVVSCHFVLQDTKLTCLLLSRMRLGLQACDAVVDGFFSTIFSSFQATMSRYLNLRAGMFTFA